MRTASRSCKTITRPRFGSGQTGFIGGGQAGYNWQSGAAVFGLETDFDWTMPSKNSTFVSSPFTGLPTTFTRRHPQRELFP